MQRHLLAFYKIAKQRDNAPLSISGSDRASKLSVQNIERSLHDSLSQWMDPSQDLVTWYKITYAGPQVAQCDKATRTSPPGPTFVLEAPLCSSMSDFVPCDQIVHRAYRPLHRRERTGKEYGCFPFVWKTKIFKWKIKYHNFSTNRSIWMRKMAKW